MTTKDMLQILIKGQTTLNQELILLKNGQTTLNQELILLKNGQRALNQEISLLKNGQDLLREEMIRGFRETHARLDKQGKQLAYLEDDAPTREEYDGLTKRVEKIKKVLSS